MRPNYNSLFVRVYALMACLGIGLGVAVAVGGDDRFSEPSFTTPRALVSWLPIAPHWVWGLMFIVFGTVLVITLGRRIAVHVLRFGIVVYLFLATSFAGSVQVDARASFVGIVFCSGLAVLHLLLSDHLTSKGWERC